MATDYGSACLPNLTEKSRIPVCRLHTRTMAGQILLAKFFIRIEKRYSLVSLCFCPRPDYVKPLPTG